MRRIQMQDIENEILKNSNLKQPCLQIQTAISKPHGNCKPKIYDRYTHTENKSKFSHHKRREQKRKGKKIPMKTNPKQLTK